MQRRLPEDRRVAIATRYVAGERATDLAREFGVGERQPRRFAEQLGMDLGPRRGPGPRAKAPDAAIVAAYLSPEAPSADAVAREFRLALTTVRKVLSRNGVEIRGQWGNPRHGWLSRTSAIIKSHYFGAADAAEYLGIDKSHLCALARSGRFHAAIKVGEVWLIPKASLDEYRESRRKR